MADPARRATTVVVTRPRKGAGRLAELLEAAGLRVLGLPALEILPPSDPTPLREAAERARAGAYDWIVFASANAVRALAHAGPAAPPRDTRVAAVGPSTAAAAAALGWRVDRVPERATAEGLLDAFEPRLDGVRVLLPAADIARDALPLGLRGRGADVEVVTAYRSVPPSGGDVERLRSGIVAGEVDLLTFTSPSTATNFREAMGEEALAVPAAVIGPVTAAAAEASGYRVVAVAGEHTVEGLAAAVAAWSRTRPG